LTQVINFLILLLVVLTYTLLVEFGWYFKG
jgi:hypothetical protein